MYRLREEEIASASDPNAVTLEIVHSSELLGELEMYAGFSARLKLLRDREKAASALGHGVLDSDPALQTKLVEAILRALAAGKGRQDVLLASYAQQIALSEALLSERETIMAELNRRTRKREATRAEKKAEELRLERYQKWLRDQGDDPPGDPPA